MTKSPANAPSDSSDSKNTYRAVPLQTSADLAAPRLCVVLGLKPEPHFIPLGNSFDSESYLGCLVDADQAVLEWLELRVQFVSGPAGGMPGQSQFLDNGNLDRRWEDACARRKSSHPGLVIGTSLEGRPSAPLLIDKGSLQGVSLGQSSSFGLWSLCTDDALLSTANLAPYHSSLERFLIELEKPSPRVVPLTPDGSGSPAISVAGEITGQPEAHLVFNPQAGRLMVSRLCPMTLTEYCDLLGGQSWEGIPDGKTHFNLDSSHTTLCDWEALRRHDGFLFNSANDRHSRLAEMLHLKIGALLQAMQQVRAATEQTQMPLLNVSHDSFRVRFGNVSSALPFLWTAQCCLTREGIAHRKTLETTHESYFMRLDAPSPSIYHPEGSQFQRDGRGDFKCRNALAAGGGTIIEGTLSVQEALPVSPQDLICVRVPVGSSRLELFGHIDATRGVSRELAFRSVPQTLNASDVDLMRQQFKFPACSFEIIPLTSSPFDLYSLAVLSIRCLLTGPRQSVNEAVDNMLSLARACAENHSAETPAAQRVRQLLTDDLLAKLGPQALSAKEIPPDEAMSIISLDLWCELLAWIIALFPGQGPDSFCSGPGDAPPTGLESVFDEPLLRLESLWLRTRRLIVSDGGMNREIHKIIDALEAIPG